MIETIDNVGLSLFFGSDSAFVDHFALIVTNALIWIPMFLALGKLIIKNNDNMQQILLCLGCIFLCVLFASGTSNFIVKPIVERLRPCNDPNVMYMAQIAGNVHSRDFSFFSAHAANTMAVATFFTLLVRSGMLSGLLVVWSLLNVWTRLYLGQHFLTDVIVGLLWGICSGILAYLIYYRLYQSVAVRKRFVSSQYTSTGYAHTDVDVVLSVFALTLLCAMIPYEEIWNMITVNL